MSESRFEVLTGEHLQRIHPEEPQKQETDSEISITVKFPRAMLLVLLRGLRRFGFVVFVSLVTAIGVVEFQERRKANEAVPAVQNCNHDRQPSADSTNGTEKESKPKPTPGKKKRAAAKNGNCNNAL